MKGAIGGRSARLTYFRLVWRGQGYGCLEYPSGSLKIVPPGETRISLGYCGACPFEWGRPGCAFHPGDGRGDGRVFLPLMPEQELMRGAACKRARGLGTNGQPLTPSCWNCAEVRLKPPGYVCRFEPEAAALSKYTMASQRKVEKTGCQLFRLRLVMEIPELEEGGGRCLK